MSDDEALQAQFARMGARLKITNGLVRPVNRLLVGDQAILDVRHDGDGEFFLIQRVGEPSLQILNVQPRDRHLLLLSRDGNEGESKHKFLCGHDERHWFVAAIPESARGVGTVQTAKNALKPQAVAEAQVRERVPIRKRDRRKNAAFLRQGEWFFLPCPNLQVRTGLVLRDEPIRRGGGKPHKAEFCYRQGGQTVYICHRYPNGLTETEYREVLRADFAARGWNWQTMRRDPQVYVRGRMSHADHKTLILRDWHRVLMNTETQAQAMANLAFLD